MVSRWLGAVVGLVVAGIATAAQAVPLVDEGINTFDPNTGLRWLDVTATVGMSYDGESRLQKPEIRRHLGNLGRINYVEKSFAKSGAVWSASATGAQHDGAGTVWSASANGAQHDGAGTVWSASANGAQHDGVGTVWSSSAS